MYNPTLEDYYEALHADDSTPERAWICACWADKPHRVALDIVERWRKAEANRDGYQIELECAEDEMRRLRADCLLDREESDRIIADLHAQLATAQAECERLREESERRLNSLKHRCVCQTNGEGVFVSECHAHAVMRSGRRENGDPVEWRSNPEQFYGPHEPAPVDLVRAELAAAQAEIERLQGAVTRVSAVLDEVEAEALPNGEPRESIYIGRLQIADEVRAVLAAADVEVKP